MPVIHLENDPAKQRSLLPEGEYMHEIQHADTEVRDTDKEVQIVLKTIVRACSDRSAVGRQATVRLGTKFMTALKALLDGTGVQHTEGVGAGGKPVLSFDTDHLVGRSFRCECTHNKGWERWSQFGPAGAVQPQAAAAPPPQAAAPHLPAPTPHMPPQGAPVHPGYQPAPQAAPPQAAPVGYPAPGGYAPAPGYPPAGYQAPAPQAAPMPAPQGAPVGYPPPAGYVPPGQGG